MTNINTIIFTIQKWLKVLSDLECAMKATHNNLV